MPVENITFNNLEVEAQTGATIREAKDIGFHNVRINTRQGSSLVAENVTGLTIDNLKTGKPVAGKPAVDLLNTANVFLYNCNPPAGTEVFLKLSGEKTRAVVLKNNNFSLLQNPVVREKTVPETAVVQ